MAEKTTFTPGEDWVWYSRAMYSDREIAAVVESLSSDWLVPGAYSEQFENAVADMFGQKVGLFVNSGSSANLLAIEAHNLPKGGEVITPACTFSTVVNPLLQCGLTPVFVDVALDTYNTNLDLLEDAITDKTVALMIPHLVGNLNDVKRLRGIADKHNLIYIEDSCDTIGGTINGEKTGTYADASTTSFYASHIITAAGGGGMVMFKDPDKARRSKVLRDWGRALPEHKDEGADKRFTFTLNGKPHDGKFVFTERGYNLKPIDLQAAFGLVQLDRLEEFNVIRQTNFKTLRDFFAQFPEHFILPHELNGADTRWLAYPLHIKEDSPLDRKSLMSHLEAHKIQTRVLFSGNILHHPAYANIPHRVHGELPNADAILSNAMLLGAHHGMRQAHLDYVMQVLSDYLKAL